MLAGGPPVLFCLGSGAAPGQSCQLALISPLLPVARALIRRFLARSSLGAEAMRGVKRDGAPPRSASLRAPLPPPTALHEESVRGPVPNVASYLWKKSHAVVVVRPVCRTVGGGFFL